MDSKYILIIQVLSLIQLALSLIVVFRMHKIKSALKRQIKQIDQFDSIEQACEYLGKVVVHNPVESPSKEGILMGVNQDGIVIIGNEGYRCWYWQCKPKY